MATIRFDEKKFHAACVKRGITKTRVLADLTGISWSCIRHATSKQGISSLTAETIAAALHTSVEDLTSENGATKSPKQTAGQIEHIVYVSREKLDELMDGAGIKTYIELSRKVGQGDNYISNIINKGNCPARKAGVIAMALGVNVDDFMQEAEDVEEYFPDDFSVCDFIADSLIADPNGRIKTNDLYQAYRIYCSSHDLKAYRKHDFYKAVRDFGMETFRSNGVDYFLGFFFNESGANSDGISDEDNPSNHPSNQPTSNGEGTKELRLHLLEIEKQLKAQFATLDGIGGNAATIPNTLFGIYKEQKRQTELLERLVKAWEK